MKKEILLFLFLFLVAGMGDGLGQSLDTLSVEKLLAEIEQASDGKSLEAAVKALERKTPATDGERRLFIQALDHPRPEVQLAAVIALGQAKVTEAVPKLIEKLESLPAPPPGTTADEEWGEKALLGEALLGALARIGDERAIEPLLNYPDSLHMGIKPLAAFGAKALPSVLRIARDPNDPRRKSMAGTIARIRDPQAIPLLLEALRDSDAEIRRNAIGALRAMRVKQAEPVFQKLLQDSEAAVRIAALQALLAAEPEKYLPAALRFLKDASPSVRGQTVDLLARRGTPEAIEPLEKLLQDPHDIVRYKAAKALEKLTDKAYPYQRTRAVELFEQEDRERSNSRRQP